jgi:hypothetical protein
VSGAGPIHEGKMGNSGKKLYVTKFQANPSTSYIRKWREYLSTFPRSFIVLMSRRDHLAPRKSRSAPGYHLGAGRCTMSSTAAEFTVSPNPHQDPPSFQQAPDSSSQRSAPRGPCPRRPQPRSHLTRADLTVRRRLPWFPPRASAIYSIDRWSLVG